MHIHNKIKFFALLMVIGILNTSFAYSVSENDGSAFITKAEFDALKSSFQSQIDTYNNNIDSKIDSAIASYLAGAQIGKVKTKSILYGGNDAEKITCMGDWSPLECVPATPGCNVLLVGVSFQAGSSSYPCTSGGEFRENFTKAAISDGKIACVDLINKKSDGSYDNMCWKGFSDNYSTKIIKIGCLAPSALPFWSHAYYSRVKLEKLCPELSSGFYEDFNTENAFFSFRERMWSTSSTYSGDSVWNDCTKYDYINQKVENTRTMSSDFKNVISWSKTKYLDLGVDDERYVYVNSKGITKENWTKSLTKTYYRYQISGNGSGGSTATMNGKEDIEKYGVGYMPIYGCLGLQRLDDVYVKNYEIQGEKRTYNNIKLIDGIPLFEGNKGDKIEWEVQMDDTDDYIFYFQTSKFTGEPDPGRCLKCTTNKSSIATTEPEIVGGKTKIYLTLEGDTVVWAKWKHKNSLGNAVLNLQRCNTYQLTKA